MEKFIGKSEKTMNIIIVLHENKRLILQQIWRGLGDIFQSVHVYVRMNALSLNN